MMRAAQQKRKELAPLLLSQTRTFVAPLRIDFTEDVSLPKGPSHTSSTLTEWKEKKAGTEELLSLLNTYKQLGDTNSEPYLKFHNPRTFEDLAAPVPNFRAANLKPGEVPKFFDSVLQRRTDAAIDKKSAWWAKRKEEALAAAKITTPFAAIPLPEWHYGKSVPLDSFKKVTDAYVKALEPKRKLLLPTLPATVKDSLTTFAASLGQAKSGPEVAQLVVNALADKAAVVEGGKTIEGFSFISKAQAGKLIGKRRAEVHDRYLKLWAKKLLVAPETAVVPLKEVDAQLASKFENIGPKYADLLAAVSLGSKTLGERVAASPAFTSFLLKREKDAVKEDFPVSDAEKEGAALAAKLEDPKVALETLLGPELERLGAGTSKLSEQVAAITEHKYTPDRYFYKEGKKLAARYAEEEKELAAELKAVYGDSVDIAHFQAHPRTPAAVLADRLKESEAVAAQLESASKAPDSTAYEQYAAAKRLELLKDPSNIPFEEVLYPGIQEELLALELAELQELEDKVDDAEEEELWLLTLTQQFKHIQKHFGVDLPHGVIAHMDPLFFKKVDWESTYGLDDWDMVLDDVASEFAREQWGTETLAHHFLPLIRYRRAKAKKLSGRFEAEQSVPRIA